mmetsp:Transcript_53347/g.169589  ORF Transcript_53347/g.169589 Transcript_53347/m.169589 type:complete len:310 (-) Transcript_53347:535-1464(-)
MHTLLYWSNIMSSSAISTRVRAASSRSRTLRAAFLAAFLSTWRSCAAWRRLALSIRSLFSCSSSILISSLRAFHSETYSISSVFSMSFMAARMASCCCLERSIATNSLARLSAFSCSRMSSLSRASSASLRRLWLTSSSASLNFRSMIAAMRSRRACISRSFSSSLTLLSCTIFSFFTAKAAIWRSSSASRSSSSSLKALSALFASMVAVWASRAAFFLASALCTSSAADCSALRRSSSPSIMFCSASSRIFCRTSSSCSSWWSRCTMARLRFSSYLRASAASASSIASTRLFWNSSSSIFLRDAICFL